MKKIIVICLILVMLTSAIAPCGASESQNAPEITAGCRSLDAKYAIGGSEQLTESADAIFLYELNTDTLVYSWNADARIDPTGMVKLLSVLVALEHGNLEDTVTVKRSTLNTVAIGSVSANLQAGEEMKLKDLLYCIMVASANDAAAVVAEHIAGTQTAFMEMVNEKALELGCTDSEFANPHGLSGTQQYSTARDLAKITAAGLENPLFTEMFCAEEYTVPATNKSEERHLITTNYMMSTTYTGKYYDSRLTGGKTAAASLTDRSLICTAEVGQARYLCVLMSAEGVVSENGFVVEYYGSFEETGAVLDYAFDGFAVRQIADSDQCFGQYAVSGGANDVGVHISQDQYTVLPADILDSDLQWIHQIDADALQAPLSAEAAVGTLEIRYKNIVLGSCDLLTMHAVQPEGASIQEAQKLTQETPEPVDYKGMFLQIAIIFALLLIAAVLVLILIRLIQSARVRRHHIRRKRNRRRSK